MDAQTTTEVTQAELDAPISIELPEMPAATPVAETPEPAVEPAATPVAAAAAEKSEFDLTIDFIEGKTDKVPAAVKPAEVKQPVKVEEEPVVAQPPPIAAKQGSTRNYEGLTEDEKKMFQNMSAQAYTKLRPIYDRHRSIEEREAALVKQEEALRNALPKGVFDTEAAFTLTEQYRNASDTVQQLNFEADYWAKQLERIESGEEWEPLMQDKDGKYFAGKARRADIASKTEVLKKMTLATQYGAQAQGQLNALQQSFNTRRSTLVQGIKDYEKKFFPFFEGNDNPHKSALDALLTAIPEEFRDHPLAGGYAKAMLTVKLLNANIQQLTKQQQVVKAAAADVKKAGPSMAAVNNAGAKAGGKQVVTVENVEAFMGL